MALNLKPGEVAAGAISRNTRKTKNGPDFTGHVNTPMGPMRISIWSMINEKTGQPFLSFSVSESGSRNGGGEVSAPPAPNVTVASVFDMLFTPPPPKPTTRTRKTKEKEQ